MSVLEYKQEIEAFVNNSLDYVNSVAGPKQYDLLYKAERVFGEYEDIFDRACPYKLNQIVFISRDLDLDHSSGWYGSRHLFKKGVPCKIVQRDFYKGKFQFGIEFLEETYYNNLTKQYEKRLNKYMYTVREETISSWRVE